MTTSQLPSESAYTREQVIKAAQAVGVPDLWLACLTDLAFEYLGKMLTAARAQPAPSPQPAAPVVSEDDLVACLISSGCVGTVKMSFESGPMSITRPSLNATKFARAILALRPDDGAATEEIRRLRAENAVLNERLDGMRPAVGPMTNEQIEAAIAKAVRERKLSWTGFRKDDHGAYTVPVLSPADYQAARAIEVAHGITAKAEGGA